MYSSYKDLNTFASVFSPTRQEEFSHYPERCVCGKAPSLKCLSLGFGRNFAETWLAFQIFELSEFSAGKKIPSRNIVYLAKGIIDNENINYLKTTDIMLFCAKYKQGTFGTFYGEVDPIKINEALIFKYLPWRAEILRKHEQEEAQKQREKWSRESVTYEQYVQITQPKQLEAKHNENNNEDNNGNDKSKENTLLD